jgi:hypothetical protein
VSADRLYGFAHSTGLCGGTCHPSPKASRGEDLQVEEPVSRGDCSSFHFHPTVAGMLRSTLIRDQVIQVRESRQKCLLAAIGMMEVFHGEQLPLDSVVRLVEQGAGDGHLRVFEHRVPARLLVLQPAPHALAIGRSSRGGDVIR